MSTFQLDDIWAELWTPEKVTLETGIRGGEEMIQCLHYTRIARPLVKV
jgi:hypothetical protein